MSPANMNVCFDVPPPRELPPARQEAIRQLLEEVVAETAHPGQEPVRRPGRQWFRRHVRPPRPARWRLVWAAATVAVLAVVTATVLIADTTGQGGVVHAATPPVLAGELAAGEPARPALDRLATTVAESPQLLELRGSSGAAESPPRIRTENWWLSTAVNGEGAAGPPSAAEGTTSAVVPVLRERTLLPDGAVHVREIEGAPQASSDEPERGWDAAGHPGPDSVVLSDETFSPGALQSSYPSPLSADPAALRQQLLSSWPQAKDTGAALLRAVHEVHAERIIGPKLRVATLRMLAAEPGLRSLGVMIDRAGRPATAVAADSLDSGLPTRHVLLLDPADGRVLGYEELLTGASGQLAVPTPVVAAYTIFL